MDKKEQLIEQLKGKMAKAGILNEDIEMFYSLAWAQGYDSGHDAGHGSGYHAGITDVQS